MEPIQLIVIGFGAVVAIYIIFRVTKFLFKLLFLALVAGLIYYLLVGGDLPWLKSDTMKSFQDNIGSVAIDEIFEGKSLRELAALCAEDETSDRCYCIISPVREDIAARFSQEEIDRSSNNPEEVKSLLKESLYNQRKTIGDCLVNKNANQLVKMLDNVVAEIKGN